MNNRVDYGNFHACFNSKAEAEEARAYRKEMEQRGWSLLGWHANEALFATAAWMKDEARGYVFSAVESNPYICEHNGAIHPDPFSAPTLKNDYHRLFVYKMPFKDGEPWPGDGGEQDTWSMDGAPPCAINEDNAAILDMTFENLESMMEFITWFQTNIN